MAVFDSVITFIYSSNMERSIDFYEKKLGFKVVHIQPNCRIYRPSNDGYLGICYKEDAPEQPAEFSRRNVVFTFVTEEVDSWFDKLRSRGVEPEEEPQSHPEYNIYSGFLRDPDGYILEIQKFNDPEWASDK